MLEFVPWAQTIIASWSYLGVFLVSLLGSASIILPLPSFAIIFFAGGLLNPTGVAVAAAFGSTVGEMFSYVIGLGGRHVLKKYRKQFNEGKKYLSRFGVLIIFVFAATPLPDDVIGLACGILKYDWRKFFVACLLGKFVLSLFLAYGGFATVNWLFGYFNW